MIDIKLLGLSYGDVSNCAAKVLPAAWGEMIDVMQGYPGLDGGGLGKNLPGVIMPGFPNGRMPGARLFIKGISLTLTLSLFIPGPIENYKME